MPNPNAIVSTVIRFTPRLERPPEEMLKAEGGLTIELEGGRQVRLDPENPKSAGFAQVLDGLSKENLPVYVEIEPDTSNITRILIPYITRVHGIDLLDKGVFRVDLEMSHARHLLRESSPDFKELEKTLREVVDTDIPVILTEDDDHEIIDVRVFQPGEKGLPPPFAKPMPLPQRAWPYRWLEEIKKFWRWPWCWWPFHWWFCCLSKKQAQQVFDAMNAKSCDPSAIAAPCIPFKYPDDGCWGRAHEMCRLLIDMGVKPKKVWIQGSLHVISDNKPNCNVYWNWHVAPIICVRRNWFFLGKYMVIDPSLFTKPVTKATWKSVQGDVNATLTDSEASIFYLWGSVTDPTYAQTNTVLATYRLQLQNRVNSYGPPPYACP
jgi:hypothetical protein